MGFHLYTKTFKVNIKRVRKDVQIGDVLCKTKNGWYYPATGIMGELKLDSLYKGSGIVERGDIKATYLPKIVDTIDYK